ncbi:DnaJ domain-containing protein [Dasania sp. GY-MA-18]|uniref:DnaJ domain-containing protein n=1 Tax=Dasania phycosphaerae TaxID=2950436 RepID=A0A9J6RHE8_9GAMM|nr:MULTISPECIES: DnaJ domain-containing protein [Dasania]MCR8921447.1 DnaJ domain-containing protein [Dasania sp. GY-MA-18]MCZ0863875.1 DnaJ domain-containing protein [Dasania phycosphaerae]MCZ0867603.1 DnaJ domain-containing protein [Dasania phycosphaerae]
MIRIILIVAIVLAVVIALKQVKNTPPAQRKKLYIKLAVGITAAVVLLLALTGRIHWIGGLIAACVPLFRAALPYALRYLPFLQAKNSEQQQQQKPQAQVNVSVDEAYQVLGLQPGADQEAVIAAHRKLIQKMHPDRGGNDYLAAQINQAKEVLLKHLG